VTHSPPPVPLHSRLPRRRGVVRRSGSDRRNSSLDHFKRPPHLRGRVEGRRVLGVPERERRRTRRPGAANGGGAAPLSFFVRRSRARSGRFRRRAPARAAPLTDAATPPRRGALLDDDGADCCSAHRLVLRPDPGVTHHLAPGVHRRGSAPRGWRTRGERRRAAVVALKVTLDALARPPSENLLSTHAARAGARAAEPVGCVKSYGGELGARGPPGPLLSIAERNCERAGGADRRG